MALYVHGYRRFVESEDTESPLSWGRWKCDYGIAFLPARLVKDQRYTFTLVAPELFFCLDTPDGRQSHWWNTSIDVPRSRTMVQRKHFHFYQSSFSSSFPYFSSSSSPPPPYCPPSLPPSSVVLLFLVMSGLEWSHPSLCIQHILEFWTINTYSVLVIKETITMAWKCPWKII